MAFPTHAAVTARPLRAVFILAILCWLCMTAADAQQPAPAPAVATPAATPAAAAPGVVTPGVATPAPLTKPTATTSAAAKAASLAGRPDVRPLWTELTPLQQQVLGPFALEWNKFDSNHKSKWLTIVGKFTTMTPEQQIRLEKNISDWANMTPEQHRLARESYARAKKLDAEQKAAQWQQYQQLPEEQKQKLAADAKTKKRIANLPSLQNKPKTVDPLKSTKKSPATRTPATANRVALPPAPVAAAPADAATSASVAVPAPVAPAVIAPPVTAPPVIKQ